MDQIKIGAFLKQLRKEKALTQEKLAEHFGVSGRTVSRWENGNNMPDLSLLVELADYYEVDIREIINGERKSDTMNREEKETLLVVADYADNEKSRLLRKQRNISFVGGCAMIAYTIIQIMGGSVSTPLLDFVRGGLIGTAFSALLVTFLYSTGLLAKLEKSKQKYKCTKAAGITALIIAAVMTITAVVMSKN